MPADPAKCRAIIPPSSEACGRPIGWVVTFRDGDKVRVCEGCKLHFEQVAAGHGTTVKTERLP